MIASWIVRVITATLALLVSWTAGAEAEPPAAFAFPIFRQPFACVEHWQGNLSGLGDALGTDCFIQELVEVDGRTWMRSHSGDGARNEDWFGWGKEVLSPCTCIVVRMHINPDLNRPGTMGKPPASSLTLQRSDRTYFLLAHVSNIGVKVGDTVRAGQVVAHVGNNGYSRMPHTHIGAWRDETPLQVRFDQHAMGKLFEK